MASGEGTSRLLNLRRVQGNLLEAPVGDPRERLLDKRHSCVCLGAGIWAGGEGGGIL